MKNKVALLFIALAIIFLCGSCNSSGGSKQATPALPAVTGDIVMYSTPTCVSCAALKEQLDASSISYNEYDINQTTYYNQMQTDVTTYASWYSAGYQISLPVVRVMGVNVLENPSVSEIQSFL